MSGSPYQATGYAGGHDFAILFSHQQGVGSDKIHKLAWDAFLAGTEIAKEQGLYGALVKIFSKTPLQAMSKEWGWQ